MTNVLAESWKSGTNSDGGVFPESELAWTW